MEKTRNDMDQPLMSSSHISLKKKNIQQTKETNGKKQGQTWQWRCDALGCN